MLKNPKFYIFIQVAALFLFFLIYKPEVKFAGDSQEYINFFKNCNIAKNGIETIFMQTRSIGFPIFLEAVKKFSPNFKLYPFFVYSIYIFSVLIFMALLLSSGFEEWMAFFITTPLFYSDIIMHNFSYILSDSLAISIVIIIMGEVIYFISHQNSWLILVGIGCCVLFAYQVRPVFQYLVFFVPFLGVLLSFLKVTSYDFKIRLKQGGAVFLKLILPLLIPFLFFCFFRLVKFGNFGIVSFAGIPMSSYAVELIDKDTIDRLPVSLRERAKHILYKRDFLMPLKIDLKDGLSRLEAQQCFSRMGICERIVLNKNEISAKTLTKTNNELLSLSLHVIACKAKSYLQFVYRTLQEVLMEVLNSFVVIILFFVFLSLLVILHMLPGTHLRKFEYEREIFYEFEVILFLGILFFAIHSLMTVCIAGGYEKRWYEAGIVFIPSIIAGGMFLFLRKFINYLINRTEQ